MTSIFDQYEEESLRAASVNITPLKEPVSFKLVQ